MELPESTIEELVQLKLDGESYSEIRSRLEKEGLGPEEVSKAIRIIDERVLEAEVSRKNRGKQRLWYRAGFALAVAGLLITVASNQGYLLANAPRWIVYSPFFAGILLMFYGRRAMRAQETPKAIREKGPGRIRSKRPYK